MFASDRPQTAPQDHSQATEGSFASRLAVALTNQIECGLVACSGDGALLYVNRAARRELDTAAVLCVVNNTLRCPGAGNAEFRAALQDAANRRRTRLLPLGDNGHRLMVVVAPVTSEDQFDQTVLVMIGRRVPCSPLGLEMLARRHGLTLTETRVLNALLASATARDIAQAHGVGMSTVRTQIQSIRNKFGVRSIDALLLHAFEVPPVTSWH
jgi:DNA-binding CsgD family transcriptional regulator